MAINPEVKILSLGNIDGVSSLESGVCSCECTCWMAELATNSGNLAGSLMSTEGYKKKREPNLPNNS